MNKYLLLALLWIPAAQATPSSTALPLPAAAPTPAAAPASPRSWASTPPADQRELRARYAAWQALSEAERQRVRHAAGAVAGLAPAQQAELRSRFSTQDQLHRDGWLLGPTLGVLYPKLQPLFGYVPPEQRAPALALLRQLNDGELAQLSLISQRTPPQDREEIRNQLLALPAAGRDAWLSEKVGR